MTAMTPKKVFAPFHHSLNSIVNAIKRTPFFVFNSLLQLQQRIDMRARRVGAVPGGFRLAEGGGGVAGLMRAGL
jgi:hypothetical protein